MEASRTPPELRPLGVSEVLDAGFRIYRGHFRTLCLCVLVVVVPVTILGTVIQASTSENAFDPDRQRAVADEGTALAGLLASLTLQGLIAVLATAACTRAVAAAYLGRDVTWQQSLRFAARRLLPVLGLAIVTVAVSVAGLFALIVPGVYLFVRLVVASPAMLVEDAGVGESLGRSWSLVRGDWWRTFGVCALVTLLVAIIAGLLQLLVTAPLRADAGSELLGGTLTTIGGIVSAVITVPLQAAVLTILYFDLRVRKEGFDLALLSEGVGRTEA